MSNQPESTRRRVLRMSAGAVALGLAGCTGAPVGASTQSDTSDSEDHHDETEHHSEGQHHEETEHPTEEEHHEEDGHEETTDQHDHSPTEHESGHGHDHEAPVTPPSDAVSVDMTTTDAGQHFEPHVVWVNPGGTVTWVNASGSHTATAYHPDNDKPLLMPESAESFDSGLLTESDAEFSHTFESEGVYHVFCAPHESAGMLGSVIVGEPDPHDQPALQEVPESLPETAREKVEHLNDKCNQALSHEH